MKIHWKFLQHNGPLFCKPFVPRGLPVYVGKENVSLATAGEHLAYMYARTLLSKSGLPPIGKANFWKAFRKHVPSAKSLDECDFSRWVNEVKNERDTLRAARAQLSRTDRENGARELVERYGTAIVDGRKEPILNFRMEAPGLFIGRESEYSGRPKLRVLPEKVTINLSKDAVVPTPSCGGKWAKVVHMPHVSWLASWACPVTGGRKYTSLGVTSVHRFKSERAKFQVARKLKQNLKQVRRAYSQLLKSKLEHERQLGTAVYLIDTMCIRVGSTTTRSSARDLVARQKLGIADTVGCCSLRCEHVRVERVSPKVHYLHLDFLGKDAVPYKRSVQVPPQVYRNLAEMLKDKHPSARVFCRTTSLAVNRYLQSLMPELSAKVFRTCNSSLTMQKALNIPIPAAATPEYKVSQFRLANLDVARLCNHQKGSGIDQKSADLQCRIEQAWERVKEGRKDVKALKVQVGLATEALARWPEQTRKTRQKKKMLKRSDAKKKAQMEDEGRERDKLLVKESKALLRKESLKLRSSEVALVKARECMDEHKRFGPFSLSTSRINYIDPRIIITWANRNNVPITKVYAPTELAKMQWAIKEIKRNNHFNF